MLLTLQRLNIRSCPLISNLNGLVKLKALTLDRVSNITSGKEIFPQLSKLVIHESFRIPSDLYDSRNDNWENTKLLSLLYNMRSLVLTNCFSVRTIPYLSRLLSLSITTCSNFQGVIPGISNLQYLVVAKCFGLQFLSIEKPEDDKYSLYSLKITGCRGLKKIRIDRKIFLGRLNCTRPLILDLKSQIGHLNCWTSSRGTIINQSQVIDLHFLSRNIKTSLNLEENVLAFQCLPKSEN
jgi:hypothetical protein